MWLSKGLSGPDSSCQPASGKLADSITCHNRLLSLLLAPAASRPPDKLLEAVLRPTVFRLRTICSRWCPPFSARQTPTTSPHQCAVSEILTDVLYTCENTHEEEKHVNKLQIVLCWVLRGQQSAGAQWQQGLGHADQVFWHHSGVCLCEEYEGQIEKHPQAKP